MCMSVMEEADWFNLYYLRASARVCDAWLVEQHIRHLDIYLIHHANQGSLKISQHQHTLIYTIPSLPLIPYTVPPLFSFLI